MSGTDVAWQARRGSDRALTALAGYSVAGCANGAVELTHERCGTSRAFGPDALDIAAVGLAVWIRDHRCPEDRRPVLQRISELVSA